MNEMEVFCCVLVLPFENSLDLVLALCVAREILGFRRRLPMAETFDVMRCNAISLRHWAQVFCDVFRDVFQRLALF